MLSYRNMTRISACIISFNEEKKIEACLQSLQGVADEIIVVDSLSEDSTVKISKNYTDKVFKQLFLGYAEQKRFAVSKASNTWILSLDCDERISPELKTSILEIKQSLDTSEACDAYAMARRTFYVYRWLNYCWYPDKKIRLFHKQKANWVGENVHESVEVSSNNIGILDGDLHHYSFDSISDHIATLDKFSELGATDILARGKKVGLGTPISHAIWTFIKLYIIKRGFLDGYAGFVVSVLSFMHVFVKYSKVICYQKLNRSQERAN